MRCVVRVLMNLEKFDTWKIAINTRLQTFIIAQIARLILSNEISDETLGLINTCKILVEHECYRNLNRPPPLNLPPVVMAKCRPVQHHAVGSELAEQERGQRRAEFAYAYGLPKDHPKKQNMQPLSFEYLLWLLETDVQPLDFTNKVDEWPISFEILVNINATRDLPPSYIENVVIAVRRIENSPVRKEWYINVVQWLSNFIIFTIYGHLYDFMEIFYRHIKLYKF